MKKLHRLFIWEFISPFILGSAVIMFILVLQFMYMYLEQIVNKGLTLEIVWELLKNAIIKFTTMAIPLGCLTGSLMSFGKLGENYELAAAKACGISLWRMIQPLLLLSVGLCLGLVWISYYIIPNSNLKFYSLMYDVQRKKAEIAIKPGLFYSDMEPYVMRVSGSNDKGMLYDVILYNHEEERGNYDIIMADSARMRVESGGLEVSMRLYSGERYEELAPESGKQNTYTMGRLHFDSLLYKIPLEGFSLDRTDEALFSRHQVTLQGHELKSAQDSIAQKIQKMEGTFQGLISRYTHIAEKSYFPPKDTVLKTDSTQLANLTLTPKGDILDDFKEWNTVELLNVALSNIRNVKSSVQNITDERKQEQKIYNLYAFEYYSMYSLPITCILFMLIGTSLGAIVRKGGLGVPALLSLFFFVLFYLMYIQGKRMAKELVFSAFTGAFIPVWVLGILAVLLVWQASVDSSILDEGARAMRWEKLLAFLKRKKERNSLTSAP